MPRPGMGRKTPVVKIHKGETASRHIVRGREVYPKLEQEPLLRERRRLVRSARKNA